MKRAGVPVTPALTPSKMSFLTVSVCFEESRQALKIVVSSSRAAAFCLSASMPRFRLSWNGVVQLPELLLIGRAKRGLRGFLCIGMDLGERKLPVNHFHLILIVRLDLLHCRKERGTIRALEIRKLNDGHGSCRGSHRRIALSCNLDSRRFQKAFDFVISAKFLDEGLIHGIAILLLQIQAYLPQSLVAGDVDSRLVRFVERF